MGSCFIEISKVRPTYEQGYLERRQNVIKEGSLWILDYILMSMPKPVRSNFPMLQKIERESPFYNGEDLILTPEEVKILNAEYNQILRIDAFEEFLPELDTNVFRSFWREKADSKEFEEGIIGAKQLLEYAADIDGWVHILR